MLPVEPPFEEFSALTQLSSGGHRVGGMVPTIPGSPLRLSDLHTHRGFRRVAVPNAPPALAKGSRPGGQSDSGMSLPDRLRTPNNPAACDEAQEVATSPVVTIGYIP